MFSYSKSVNLMGCFPSCPLYNLLRLIPKSSLALISLQVSLHLQLPAQYLDLAMPVERVQNWPLSSLFLTFFVGILYFFVLVTRFVHVFFFLKYCLSPNLSSFRSMPHTIYLKISLKDCFRHSFCLLNNFDGFKSICFEGFFVN